MNIPNFYESRKYRHLLVVPVVLIIVALALIFFNGIPQGVDLKGGVLLTVQTQDSVDVSALRMKLGQIAAVSSVRSFSSPTGTGIEIELEHAENLERIEAQVKALQVKDGQLRELEGNVSTATDADITRRLGEQQIQLAASVIQDANAILVELGDSDSRSDAHEAVQQVVRSYGDSQDRFRSQVLEAVKSELTVTSFSFREVGPSLSKFFLEKARDILLWSFILAAIVVLLTFRSIVPSVAVVLGAVVDILVTMGAMSLFNIPLTLASIAGLLMLIGFSLDTDIMLTMRVLKRKEGTAAQRAFGAFKTGALMNLTTIGAFGTLALAGLYLQIPTYFEIGIVATMGGFIDFAATWGLNAVLVLMYAERREAKV